MTKFEIGKKYRVENTGWDRNGNVIEITGKFTDGYRYKTTFGKDGMTYFMTGSEFSAFLIPHRDRHELRITSDGTTTNAVYKLNGKVEKTAKAVCCPSDTFNFNTGAELAINRVLYGTDYNPKDVALKKPIEAMQNQPKEVVTLYCVKDFTNWGGIKWLTKGETYIYDKSGRIKFNGEYVTMKYSSYLEFCSKNPDISACLIRAEKRPASVGEWVVIIDGGDWHGNLYKNGEFYRADRISPLNPNRCYCTLSSGEELFLGKQEYLVLPDYIPEKVEPVYYSGKVVCVETSFSIKPEPFTIGKVYEYKDGLIMSNLSLDPKSRWYGKPYNDRCPTKTEREALNRTFAKFIPYLGEQSC